MSDTRANNSPAPSINVTPLIDVLLVMLIIFMVASPCGLIASRLAFRHRRTIEFLNPTLTPLS